MTKTKKIKLLSIFMAVSMPLFAFAVYKTMPSSGTIIGNTSTPVQTLDKSTGQNNSALEDTNNSSEDNPVNENNQEVQDSIKPNTAATSPSAPSPTTQTSPSTPPATAPSTTGPKPTGASGTWSLDFEDNFNNTSLDLSKWRPNWIGGSDTTITPPINTREESCYDPAQVSVSDGALKLLAQSVIAGSRPGCVLRSGADANYASGIVTSYHDYRFTHGFVESRIWLPPSTGAPQNFPAFWVNGLGPWPKTGEIDIMEALGGVYKWHFHYEDTFGAHQSYGGGTGIIANVGGWHTFGANWQPDKITFYYDGINAGSVTNNVTSSEMYLVLNNGLSSSISPPIVAPSEMRIDYVRVWK